MIGIYIIRKQVSAAGLDPDQPLKILEGRLVSVVLEDGLKRGDSRKARLDGSEDYAVAPTKAVLHQWANSAELVVTPE